MKQKNKGFTIVELVIVIAVIAIMAAVLIPTFSSVVKKAKLSADQQAVRQMNTAIQVASVDGRLESIDDVYEVLEQAGFNAQTYNTLSNGGRFVWIAEEQAVALVGEDNVVSYPEQLKGVIVTPENSVNLVKDKPIDPNNLGYADAPVATVPRYEGEYDLERAGAGVNNDEVLEIALWTFTPSDTKRDINEYDPITEKKQYEQRKKYSSWIADFYIKANNEFDEGTVGIFGKHFTEVAITAPDKLEKDFNFLLMKDMYPELSNFLTYEFLIGICIDNDGGFTCGVYNLSPENVGKSITVELRLYEPIKDENGEYTSERSDKYVVCGDTITYKFTKEQ